MFYRQKVLLGLLESFGGELPSTDFQKYLFLYTRLCEKNRSYEFVPYKFGCFSFQSYADKSKLIDLGYLEDCNDWKLASSRASHIKQLSKGEDKKFDLLKSKYSEVKGKDLLKQVYRSFPYFAINSLIAEDILTEDEYASVKQFKRKIPGRLFATIGYEGLSIEQYLNRLIENDVRLLVDVRKNPLSRKYGFSKTKLSELLGKVGIPYVHLPDLGIVSDKRKSLKTQADYNNLFDDYEKTVLVHQGDALKKLNTLFIEKNRIAITCFEESHTMCHRNRVADAIQTLQGEGFNLVHI